MPPAPSDATAASVLRIATVAVLKSSRGKFSCDQTLVKLSIWGEKVHAWVSVRQRPGHSMSAADASDGSTNVLDSRPFTTSIRLRVVPSMGTA